MNKVQDCFQMYQSGGDIGEGGEKVESSRDPKTQKVQFPEADRTFFVLGTSKLRKYHEDENCIHLLNSVTEHRKINAISATDRHKWRNGPCGRCCSSDEIRHFQEFASTQSHAVQERQLRLREEQEEKANTLSGFSVDFFGFARGALQPQCHLKLYREAYIPTKATAVKILEELGATRKKSGPVDFLVCATKEICGEARTQDAAKDRCAIVCTLEEIADVQHTLKAEMVMSFCNQPRKFVESFWLSKFVVVHCAPS